MGMGAKDNWQEFEYRMKQADLDASVFKDVLQRVDAFHQVRLALLVSRPSPRPLGELPPPKQVRGFLCQNLSDRTDISTIYAHEQHQCMPFTLPRSVVTIFRACWGGGFKVEGLGLPSLPTPMHPKLSQLQTSD